MGQHQPACTTTLGAPKLPEYQQRMYSRRTGSHSSCGPAPTGSIWGPFFSFPGIDELAGLTAMDEHQDIAAPKKNPCNRPAWTKEFQLTRWSVPGRCSSKGPGARAAAVGGSDRPFLQAASDHAAPGCPFTQAPGPRCPAEP